MLSDSHPSHLKILPGVKYKSPSPCGQCHSVIPMASIVYVLYHPTSTSVVLSIAYKTTSVAIASFEVGLFLEIVSVVPLKKFKTLPDLVTS